MWVFYLRIDEFHHFRCVLWCSAPVGVLWLAIGGLYQFIHKSRARHDSSRSGDGWVMGYKCVILVSAVFATVFSRLKVFRFSVLSQNSHKRFRLHEARRRCMTLRFLPNLKMECYKWAGCCILSTRAGATLFETKSIRYDTVKTEGCTTCAGR